MGWRSWNDHRGNIKYKMPHYFHTLRKKDKVTASYITKHIHGLTFNAGDHERPKEQECLYQDIYELYNTFKIGQSTSYSNPTTNLQRVRTWMDTI